MAEYVTLMGAEDVSRASGTIREAASAMQTAAGSIAYSVETLSRIADSIVAALADHTAAMNALADESYKTRRGD